MSDYLTRLIERSLGIAPQIEPLIAPIHAPSGQMLSETVETPATFDLGPAAKIETSEQEASPGAAVNAREAEPAFSRAESQAPRSSTPRAIAQAAFPIRENDRPHSGKTPPSAMSRPAPPASRLDTSPPPASRSDTSPPTPPPIPGTTRMVPKRRNQIVVQPEFISHLKPAATPAVSSLQPSPKEPPAIHVTIGRVEVRAIMSPVAAPKPTPPSAPKLSLEDYLKQRNGGKS